MTILPSTRPGTRRAATAQSGADGPVLVDRSLDAGVIERVRNVARHRELLLNLIRKELKVKYKNSALGFLWSLANPALYLVVFYVVFELILKSGIPEFPIFLLCGLIPWTFFSAAVGGGTVSVVQNSSLVKKVAFPREILPLASVGAAFVHFLLQMSVLVAALLAFQHGPNWEYVPLLLPAVLAMAIFAAAVGILLAAANVYLRDVEHLVELLLLGWFWMTPIVYGYRTVADRLEGFAFLYLFNPMADVVITFQRALYNILVGKPANGNGPTAILPDESVWWYFRNVGLTIAASIVLLFVALRIFGRAEGNFAEEI